MNSPARVLIVSASMGAGHQEVSFELARRLTKHDMECEVVDLLAAAGRAGDSLREVYRFLLRRTPWVYDTAMRAWARRPGFFESLTGLGAAPFDDAILAAAARVQPALIISTYNLASQRIGRLVAAGRLAVPTATVVIDAGAHPYWVSPHIGAHLAPTPATADGLRKYGAGSVELAAPALRPEFGESLPRPSARARLGLPAGLPVALVTGGSWGAGEVARIVDAVTGADRLTVVLCGRNEPLRRSLSGRPGVRAVGWTDQMAAYLAAADVLVSNGGALTCWEALACGTPVIIYRPLPGHGRLNALTLQELQLADYVQDRDDLQQACRASSRRGAPRPAFGRDPAELLAGLVSEPSRSRQKVA